MKIDKCGRNVATHNTCDRLKRLKKEKALRDCNKVPQSLMSVRPGKPDGGFRPNNCQSQKHIAPSASHRKRCSRFPFAGIRRRHEAISNTRSVQRHYPNGGDDPIQATFFGLFPVVCSGDLTQLFGSLKIDRHEL